MFVRNILRCRKQQTVQEFHTGIVNMAKKSKFKMPKDNYNTRQSGMIKKMLTGSNRSWKKFYSVPQTADKQAADAAAFGLGMKSSTTSAKRELSNRGKRRLKVLNTVFCKQITSLLSTGDGGSEVLDLGLQINAVRINSDFSQIEILWEPTGTPNDEILEKELVRAAGRVRHLLCETRIMGIIPPIIFIKDPFRAKVLKVEQALATCDFGPDFVPTDLPQRLKAMKPIPVNTIPMKYARKSIHAALKEELQKLQAGENEFIIDTMEKKPETKPQDKYAEEILLRESLEKLSKSMMTNSILGVEHTVIMNKIKHAVENSKVKKQSSPDDYIDQEASSHYTNTVLPDPNPKRTQEFLTYLRQKHYSKQKVLKNLETEIEDNVRESEYTERWNIMQQAICDDSLDIKEEEDFILEDETPHEVDDDEQSRRQ